jgi:hypothetical protein
MKLSQHVINVRNQDGNVQDTKTTSTLSFGMRLKPPRGELGRPATGKNSTQALVLQVLLQVTLRYQT